MSWQQKKLGDIADLLVGFAFKSQYFLNASEDGVRLVRGDNVQQGFLRWGDKAKKWNSAEFEDFRRYQLEKDDVLLAMDRPVVGGGLKLAWVKELDLPCLLVQRVTRIRGAENLARTNFLRYVLSTPEFLGHIESVTTGANIPHISGKDIASFELKLPSLVEQDRIVEILSAYDELMDANIRRIELLEESARLLYREWFVNLRFPGFEQASLTNGLPDGWHIREVCSLVKFLNRGITPKYDESAKGLVINQKCIRGGRLSLKPARRQSKEVKPERLIQLGDILINSTGAGTLGRVAQVRSQIEDCTVDTHVTIARPSTPESISFLGVALLELEPTLSTMGVGSTNQLELGRTDIGAIKLRVPSAILQQEFHSRVWSLFEQVDTLAQTNELLAHARNEFLPKLISGAIQV